MLRLLRPDGGVVTLGSMLDQVYTYEDEQGTQFYWSVTAALVFAQAKEEHYTISLSEMGITLDLVRQMYEGLDESYALTRDLSQPLLFVPIGEKVRLIDGWHRVAHALLTGVDVLPACFLTQEEADECLLVTLPPEEGLEWGHKDTPPKFTTKENGSKRRRSDGG